MYSFQQISFTINPVFGDRVMYQWGYNLQIPVLYSVRFPGKSPLIRHFITYVSPGKFPLIRYFTVYVSPGNSR